MRVLSLGLYLYKGMKNISKCCHFPLKYDKMADGKVLLRCWHEG